MEVLFWLILVCVALFFFVPSVRLWVLRLIGERIQKKMQRLFEEQMRQQASRQNERNTSAHETNRTTSTHREKLDIDSIEAKRFEKENSRDYVDFEELPK